MYITASLPLTAIGKPLPKACSLHSITSYAQSYPLQNYISREEFTFTDHYLNQLINSLINYFYFFQNSQNTIASFTLGFPATIHSLFSFTGTPLYIEEIHCSLQPYPKTLSRQLPLKMLPFLSLIVSITEQHS